MLPTLSNVLFFVLLRVNCFACCYNRNCEQEKEGIPQVTKYSPLYEPRGKRKQWTDTQMVSALDEVLTKQLPANKARLYGVPPSTLKDHLSGRVVHDVKPRLTPYLITQEEKELAEHLVLSAKVGYGKTRRDVMNLVETYITLTVCVLKSKIKKK